MTDKDIVKALEQEIRLTEYVDSDYADVKLEIIKSSLDLINHQKEEIEFLRKTMGKNAKRALDVTLEEIEKSRVEAITEFVDRLKENIANCHTVSDGEYVGYDWEDITDCIDNLVKEMIGDTE